LAALEAKLLRTLIVIDGVVVMGRGRESENSFEDDIE
jgi:hypothetical protein